MIRTGILEPRERRVRATRTGDCGLCRRTKSSGREVQPGICVTVLKIVYWKYKLYFRYFYI